jgi:hypothetical protein
VEPSTGQVITEDELEASLTRIQEEAKQNGVAA